MCSTGVRSSDCEGHVLLILIKPLSDLIGSSDKSQHPSLSLQWDEWTRKLCQQNASFNVLPVCISVVELPTRPSIDILICTSQMHGHFNATTVLMCLFLFLHSPTFIYSDAATICGGEGRGKHSA